MKQRIPFDELPPALRKFYREDEIEDAYKHALKNHKVEYSVYKINGLIHHWTYKFRNWIPS